MDPLVCVSEQEGPEIKSFMSSVKNTSSVSVCVCVSVSVSIDVCAVCMCLYVQYVCMSVCVMCVRSVYTYIYILFQSSF